MTAPLRPTRDFAASVQRIRSHFPSFISLRSLAHLLQTMTCHSVDALLLRVLVVVMAIVQVQADTARPLTRWTTGELGQSCDDACAERGLTCDVGPLYDFVGERTNVALQDKFNSAMNAVRHGNTSMAWTCSSYEENVNAEIVQLQGVSYSLEFFQLSRSSHFC